MFKTDAFASIHQANVDALFGLTQKAYEGVEKLVELNTTAVKAMVGDATNHFKAILSAKDPQEFMALQTAFFQPVGEKAAAYGRHMYAITSASAAEFTQAFEAQTAEAQQKFAAFVETAASNAPAGSEAGIAFFKNAIATATNAADSLQKSMKQAAQVAETNFSNLTEQAASVGKSAAKKR